MTHPDTPRPPMSETVKPLTKEEIAQVRDIWLAPWVGIAEPNLGQRMLATIADLEVKLGEAMQFHPMPIPPHDPKVIADLQAMPSSQIIDRLRGIYTIPVNDGAGPLNGSDTFTRRYFTGAIQHEAAKRLEKAERDLAQSREQNEAMRVAMQNLCTARLEGNGSIHNELEAIAKVLKQAPPTTESAP